MFHSLLNFISFLLFLTSLNAQSSIPVPVIDTSQNGIVYFLMVLIFSVAYGVPILLWMVRIFNSRLRERKLLHNINYNIQPHHLIIYLFIFTNT